MPDERFRAMRRRLARREQLVRARSRAKNEIHAVLMRRLRAAAVVGPVGVKGRTWLRELELPVEEAETVGMPCATSSSSTQRSPRSNG